MNERFIIKFQESGLTMYSLSKKTGVPYTVINELVNQKKEINQRPAETLCRLAVELRCGVEDLIDPFPIMDKTEGKYRGVHYKWIYDKTMKLELRSKCVNRTVDTEYQLMLAKRKDSYLALAESIIDEAIEQYTSQKGYERYLRRRKHNGRLYSDA